jgi:rhodanese-related sulfurtransferase
MDLTARVPVGEALVLDVRPRDEYDFGHLPGALSVPTERSYNALRLAGQLVKQEDSEVKLFYIGDAA